MIITLSLSFLAKLARYASCFGLIVLSLSSANAAETLSTINDSSNAMALKPFSRTAALTDPYNKISKDFAIPAKLKKRTEFWFDIYTRYGSNDHVIHHILYPWIVFKTISTQSIADSKLHRWTKYHKAKKVVATETRQIRVALNNLARRRSYRNLKGLEKELFAALKAVPGRRKTVFLEAAKNVRVQLGQKDFFLSGVATSTKYLPHIEAEFTARGLPLELTRLPFVESSFNIHAESKVGASGIWQIMPATGKSLLLVTDNIDERNSPLKASIAASQILKSNYAALKDWPLAVTAYNHGASGIKRVLKKSKTTNLPDLIEKYHAGSFKFASANFYTSFLAVLHAQRYKREIFSKDDLEFKPTLEAHVLLVDRPIRFHDLLKEFEITERQVLEYNLDLKIAARKNARIPRGYKIILPAETHEKIKEVISSGSPYFKAASLSKLIKVSS